MVAEIGRAEALLSGHRDVSCNEAPESRACGHSMQTLLAVKISYTI